jgi:signal transduction histidine kinase
VETAALPVSGDAAPAADGVRPEAGDSGSKSSKRAAQHLEKRQEATYAALAAVSSHLDSDDVRPTFFGRLSATVAELVGARRAAFWRLGPGGVLTLEPEPFGFPDGSLIHNLRIQLGANGEGIIERVVFRDELDALKDTSPQLDALWHEKGLIEVNNSIAVAWRAGERRLGAIAAYDSPGGFSAQDLWVLRLAGIASGLLSEYKDSEIELDQTAVRLEEAMAARRHLLSNIAAGGDAARRRFASVLHDDALQLLTGAELQLERMRAESNGSAASPQIEQLRNTLRKVEDSLRRLLMNVSPESLVLPHDMKKAISERLESMRLRAGIETHLDCRLPDDVPEEIQALVLKNVSEALTNCEKHAHATRVMVIVEVVDGGLHVEVSDDGAGFVVAESVHLPGHLGLLAMRERAQMAGGWCHIESEPGAGAKVEFWVPLSL